MGRRGRPNVPATAAIQIRSHHPSIHQSSRRREQWTLPAAINAPGRRKSRGVPTTWMNSAFTCLNLTNQVISCIGNVDFSDSQWRLITISFSVIIYFQNNRSIFQFVLIKNYFKLYKSLKKIKHLLFLTFAKTHHGHRRPLFRSTLFRFHTDEISTFHYVFNDFNYTTLLITLGFEIFYLLVTLIKDYIHEFT